MIQLGLSRCASAYYGILRRLDLGANAASLYDGDAAPWSARLEALYPSGPRSDFLQTLPLMTPNADALLRALRGRGAFESALAGVFETYLDDYPERTRDQERRLDAAARSITGPLETARRALWQRAGRTPPAMLVLDVRTLGRHGRGASVADRQVVAASFALADEDLFCLVLHEDTHAVSDPDVVRDLPLERSTAKRDAGYPIHRAVESAALRLADEVVPGNRAVDGEAPRAVVPRSRDVVIVIAMSQSVKWQGETQKLRSILLDCGLDEAKKWGKPCFSYEGKNVAIIQRFKAHCALMFFKGVLLEDTHGLLRSQGENTQSAKRLEFTSEADIKKTVVKSYVKQAIVVAKEGREVEFKARHELELPDELTQILAKDRRLARAFEALTPGRRRGYVLHITGAKQSKTRTARIEKCAPKILAGKGFNDR